MNKSLSTKVDRLAHKIAHGTDEKQRWKARLELARIDLKYFKTTRYSSFLFPDVHFTDVDTLISKHEAWLKKNRPQGITV